MAKPPKAKIDLGELDGVPVESTGIEIPNAGGGLNKAMAIEPMLITHDDGRMYLALEVELRKVRFEPITNDDEELTGYRRVHVMHATGAAPVDGDTVIAAIDAMREKVQLAEEAKAGTQRLPMDLEVAHDKGDHQFMAYPECTRCVDEGRIEAPTTEGKRAPKKRGAAKLEPVE